MSTREALSFVVLTLILGVVLLVALLTVPGFDGMILLVAGAGCAYYFWPQIPEKIRNWHQMRQFRKELDKH